jgi:hypothetical protein
MSELSYDDVVEILGPRSDGARSFSSYPKPVAQCSCAALDLKLIALQHQLAVLRRQRPGRPPLSSLDRLLWVWLYRIWPQVIDAMILVKPATVVQWHRKGFRQAWHRLR